MQPSSRFYLDAQRIDLQRVKGEQWPDIDAAYIARLTSEVSAPLPDDYVDFLLDVGGACGPNAEVLFGSGAGRSTLNVLFGVDGKRAYDILKNARTYSGRVPSELLPIGNDPGGNLLCIGITAPHRGKVFFWNHEDEGEEGSPHWRNVYHLADSFTQFLRDLEVIAEP